MMGTEDVNQFRSWKNIHILGVDCGDVGSKVVHSVVVHEEHFEVKC
jgi:hypothetical protein